ncbi:MAG: ATP-grasp domain-containing protein [Steroidobacteraceae bacterium]
MSTILLTLGRLPKALELARALHAAGCRVLVAEPFERHLTGASRAVARSFVVPAPASDPEAYLRALTDIVRREGVDLVLPVSEEILHVAALRERLPSSVRVASMPLSALLSVYDKQAFVLRCREAGLAAPETSSLGDPSAAELENAAATVVKPRYSCSGRGVQFLDRSAVLPQVDEPAIVQAFVRGELLSTFGFARHGRLHSTVVYRAAVLQGTVAVCCERLDLTSAVEEWISRFVAHTQFDGFVSFDLMQDADGVVWGIECNPRTTSGIHFVEPTDLAASVLQPDQCPPWRFKAGRLRQQFYPCLTETQASMFTSRFGQNLRYLSRADDVSWRFDDPWPFIGMPWTSWPIIERAMKARCTFGEVAMRDFDWRAPCGALT